jgi:hypothetical protein
MSLDISSILASWESFATSDEPTSSLVFFLSLNQFGQFGISFHQQIVCYKNNSSHSLLHRISHMIASIIGKGGESFQKVLPKSMKVS